MESTPATLVFIGRIHSPLTSLEECPMQENEGAPSVRLEVFSEFRSGIQNITAGMELTLMTWLHKADRSVITCFPRREYEAPPVGVFSTRSPDRPNPIGLHRVRITAIEGEGMLTLDALEVLDQTPVVDIKPVWNEV